jgi:hypothetical protein
MEVQASVYTLAVLTDGRILAGTRTNLICLNGDGSVDPYFQSDFHGLATKILPMADGRILVGGQAGYDRFALEPLMLLKSNGVADKSFAPDFSGTGLLIVNDFDFNQKRELFAAGQFLSAALQGTNAYGPNLVGFHFLDPPPALSTPQRREGDILFKAAPFNPTVGEKYAVESSEDLANWIVLSTNVTSHSSGVITATIESQNRFFRVRRQP